MSTPGCYCAGCIGVGPCDDDLGRRGDECGNCALEAQHGGPCAYICNACKGRGGREDAPLCEPCDGTGLIYDRWTDDPEGPR